jgi:hypothetical protein
MADTRTPRDLVSREKTARYVYKPSSALPDPTPEPGYAFRWIATHILGQADPTNVSRKMRDGWEPVKAADHPELMIQGNAATGNVEVGGLMLCKIAEERLTAMTEYYDNVSQQQSESVDNNFLRQNDPRMPLFAERKSAVTRGAGFGSGTK